MAFLVASIALVGFGLAVKSMTAAGMGVVAIAVGIGLGELLPVDRLFKTVSGWVAALIVATIYVALVAVLQSLLRTVLPLEPAAYLGLAVAGLDWKRADRLRPSVFLSGLLLAPVVGSPTSATLVIALLWLAVALATLWTLQGDTDRGQRRAVPIRPPQAAADDEVPLRGSELLRIIGGAAMLSIALTLLIGNPSCDNRRNGRSPYSNAYDQGASSGGRGGYGQAGGGGGGVDDPNSPYIDPDNPDPDGRYYDPNDPRTDPDSPYYDPNSPSGYGGNGTSVRGGGGNGARSATVPRNVSRPGSGGESSRARQPGRPVQPGIPSDGSSGASSGSSAAGGEVAGGSSSASGGDLTTLLYMLLGLGVLTAIAAVVMMIVRKLQGEDDDDLDDDKHRLFGRRKKKGSPNVAWAKGALTRLSKEGERRGRPRRRAETVVRYCAALAVSVLPDERLNGVGNVLDVALYGPREATSEEIAWVDDVLADLESMPRVDEDVPETVEA